MSVTTDYTAVHNAFAAAAARIDQPPMVARVAFALHDRGGTATSHELEFDIGQDGSMVRRALGAMYAAGLAEGFGSDGGPRRPGTVSRVTLTSRGRQLVANVLRGIAASRMIREPVRAAA